VSQKTGPLPLISQHLLIVFGTERPYIQFVN